jgi:hypothetical protein
MRDRHELFEVRHILRRDRAACAGARPSDPFPAAAETGIDLATGSGSTSRVFLNTPAFLATNVRLQPRLSHDRRRLQAVILCSHPYP